MGKFAIITVAATLLALTGTYIAQERRSYETRNEEAAYEGQVLARKIAESGFSVVERRLQRDFFNFRGSWDEVTQGEGHYSISAVGTPRGPVDVTSTGVYRGFTHTINGQFELRRRSVVPPLAVDGDVLRVNFNAQSLVSGLDTNPDGSDGLEDDVHALIATTEDAYDAIVNRVNRDALILGKGGAEDVVQADLPLIDLPGFAEVINAYAGPELIRYAGNTRLRGETLGTPEHQVVVIAERDFNFQSGSTGYGVLFVKGDLELDFDARWEGLVFAAGEGAKITVMNRSAIYGALAVGVYEESAGEFERSVDEVILEVKNQALVQYSSLAIERVAAIFSQLNMVEDGTVRSNVRETVEREGAVVR